MCTYLAPPRNGTYYFRRSIPKHLRAIIGMREFIVSLGVKDREAAKRLVPQHTADTQRQLDEAEARFLAEGPADSREAIQAAERARVAEEAARASAERFAARAKWRDHWRTRMALSTAELSPEEAALRDLYDAGELGAGSRDHDRLDAVREPVRAVYEAQVADGSASRLPRRAPAVSIRAMFDGYADRSDIRPETVKQFRAIIEHLVGYIAHDDASRVTAADLVRWREHLRKEPVKGRTRSPKTINDSYLAAANAVFGYGLDQLSIPANPVKDVAKVRAGRAVKLRDKDFTRAERRTILAGALTPPGDNTSAERVAARRWVPWLCAYTGARVNEMTQLRAEDVREMDGVWAIHITPEAGAVKTDQARWVPIHEHLIAQGFLDFVKGRTGPLFYNPGRSRGGMVRGQNKRVGMYLAEWVRSLGVTDQSIKPNHAWRHTFKTVCLEAGVEERAADYMQGHATKGVGRTYGTNTMAALSAQMARFPRYSLSAA